ncbi:MAG: ATP synthase F0 subunit B [Nitrospiraceae bacterium]|nr:MAG: ATP synthase F0 subunit B [Nitrospiraceae bacterium]
MLEINYWFFVQLANFILLLIILNTVLFKPMLRLFSQREENTRGALDRARELDREKDEVIAEIDKKLSGARNEARAIFEELSGQGLDGQRGAIEAAQQDAVDINRKAKGDLEAAVEKARASLKSDVEKFARQIVGKLVGA